MQPWSVLLIRAGSPSSIVDGFLHSRALLVIFPAGRAAMLDRRGDASLEVGVLDEVGARTTQTLLLIDFAHITEAGLALIESCIATCLMVRLHQKGVVAKP